MVSVDATFDDAAMPALAALLFCLDSRIFFAVDRLERGFLKALEPGLREVFLDAGERLAPPRTAAPSPPEVAMPFLSMMGMRMVRFGQKQFMEWDLEMTHNTVDLDGNAVSIPAQVRSMDQNDDCGQVGI